MGLVKNRQQMLLACVAIVAASSASAQEAGQAETLKKSGRVTLLERIVVGAGEEKVAIDTPQAVTVLNQEDIDNEQVSTIGELFDSVPGVTAIGSDRIAGQSFNIRGIGSLAAADESKILINVDGTAKFYEQYRMGSLFTEPELYKQVEVLRGPASSTLYGAGALGGTINLTTKDAADFLEPGQTSALKLKSTYESNGNGVLGSGIFATRLSDTTDFLFAGNYRRSGLVSTSNGTNISGSDFNAWSGLAKLTHHFADNEEEVMRFSYQQWQSDADDTDYSQTGTLGFGTVDRKIYDRTATFSYENPMSDNPWLDLNFSLSYSDTTVIQDDASSTTPSALFADTTYAYRTWNARLENTIDTYGDSFENHFTTGLQFAHQRRLADASGYTNISFHPQGTDTKLGLYMQDEFVWDDRLTLIPGVRADFVWQVPDSSITGAANVNTVALSPKLAAHYKINDALAVFGSIAHTQRTPTLDELYSYSATQNPSLTLAKEKSNNFEFGFAVNGNDILQDGDAFQIKTTAFQNNLTNLIERGTGTSYYVNVGKARIRGIEVEAAYDTEYAFATAAWSMMEGLNLSSGGYLTSVPANSLATTIGARIPDRNIEFGWKSYFAAPISSGATTGPFSDYNLHGAYVSWTPDEGDLAGFELRASVDNIFNVSYQNNLSGDKGKGRTFKVSLAKLIGW